MRGTGDKPRIAITAMARGKSPWGGGKGGGDASEGTEASPPPEDGETKEAEAVTDTAEAPSRNPWLPAGEDSEGRRSPRIDDILRQRRGSGSGGGLPGRARARAILPWVIAGSVLALALSSSLHMVEQGQSGIVTTLGRYNRSLGPGMHLTLPWPLETVSLRGDGGAEVLSLPDKEGEMLLLTRDGELIDLAFNLRWQVGNARRFAAAFADADATIADLSQAEMRAAVAEMPFDDIWNGTRHAELQQRVAGRVQRALDAMRAGVKIDGVEVTRANPPGRLAEAFKKVATEKEEARRVRKQAEDWAGQQVANARIEAETFNRVYEQYRLAPQVMRSRMYYEMMENVLRNNANVVIGGSAAAVQSPPSPTGGR